MFGMKVARDKNDMFKYKGFLDVKRCRVTDKSCYVQSKKDSLNVKRCRLTDNS